MQQRECIFPMLFRASSHLSTTTQNEASTIAPSLFIPIQFTFSHNGRLLLA